ncbi:phosphodiester glycosidase family protein [Nannocystis radixulma]|uniref:Phosphodiester glycosidase family protein n=1 Tax=Nannocystis radixulma TaxID=2995305 RepID=A0ABT5B193_9BACT|nr:phosphodiester glycosidase family protein [Nannocystis radixulma]MDC0667873.1 phosphodiester glycosidase family protein [Nannocystis radixulma]
MPRHGSSLAPLLAFVTLSLVAASAGAVEVTVSGEESPYPGVRVQTLKLTGPTARAWAVFVDLCTEQVRVGATAAPQSLRTAGSWADSVGAQVAVNGDFYKTGPVRVYGAAVGGGAAWPAVQTGTDPTYDGEWYYQDYGWIAFGPHWVEFNHSGWTKQHPDEYPTREGWRPTSVTHAVPHGTVALVSGFPELVVEGKRVTCTDPTADTCFPDRTDMRARHPRSAMGLTEDRRTFILLAVDGRTNVSAGLYGAELAEVMEKLGAWEAFNLDGGGSTQLWVEGDGYINDTNGNNSGGGTRAVANHWGIFAGSGATAPGHCVDYLVEGLLNAPLGQPDASSDIDGDGLADACIRAADGIRCARGGALGEDELFVGLDDDSGWGDLSNATTLRTGDLDGDGRADLCARANAGVRCWRSDLAPLATELEGPALADESGWNAPAYFSTLRLADVTGDGRDDLCARAAAGLRCYPSTGAGFDAAIESDAFSDDAGFADPANYTTLRMGDVDGDGRADACARTDAGVECRLAAGEFTAAIAGPAWSDDLGWSRPAYFSTIRLADVDHDGRADLCARASAGFRCHLATGTGFGEAVDAPILADADGGDAPAVYSTIRLADIDGDADLDVCARDGDTFGCWAWTGAGFGARIDGPASPDDAWLAPRIYAGPRLADVDGDRRADLCVRTDSGLQCYPSTGTGFLAALAGPAWAGPNWESPAVFGTLQLGGPRCQPLPELCNGHDDDCDGVVDDDCIGGVDTTGDATGDATGDTPDSTGPAPTTGAGVTGDAPTSSGSGATADTSAGSGGQSGEQGCACTTQNQAPAPWLLLALLLGSRRRAVRRPRALPPRRPACYRSPSMSLRTAPLVLVALAACFVDSGNAAGTSESPTTAATLTSDMPESTGGPATGAEPTTTPTTTTTTATTTTGLDTGTTGAPPATCPCFGGDGPYCGHGVAVEADAAGCEVAVLAGHEGDILHCEAGEWSLGATCEAGCEVTAPGEADACLLPVCACFVKEAWCGSGAAAHGLTLDPPCTVPLVPEHNNDILGCDGETWIVKQMCEKGCHEEMVGVPDSCNDDSDYKLPYACGDAFTCSQANFGSSHQGSQAYAWDFAMPKGTPVHAARGGTIAYLEMRSPAGSQCYDPPGLLEACHNKANFIGIKHADGTVALYMHLREMKVQKGDVVQQGQLIALSGNSGYTSGPHLHFQLQNDCGIWFCSSVPVSFADAPGLAKNDSVASGNCP